MPLPIADEVTDSRRLSGLTNIHNNVRSFLREFPSPSSRYSQSQLPDDDDFDRRRSSGYSAFRELLGHGRFGGGSAHSSVSHLPLTRQDALMVEHDEAEEGHHEIDDDEPPISPLGPSPDWEHIREPAEPEPAIIHIRYPSGPPPPFPSLDSDRDVEMQSPPAPAVAVHSRRKKKRRRRRFTGSWVRKSSRRDKDSCVPNTIQARTIACCVATLFFCVVLGTYLSVALTQKGLGPEFHVLLLLTLTATLIFFTRNLYCLGLLKMRTRPPMQARTTSERSQRSQRSQRAHRSHRSRDRVRIPSVAGPEGFSPEIPIQVHLLQDDEIRAMAEDGSIEQTALESLKAPPPAYGLWRESVKANPSFLHWVRVDTSPVSASTSTTCLLQQQAPMGSSPLTTANIGLLSRSQAQASTPGAPSASIAAASSTLDRIPEMTERTTVPTSAAAAMASSLSRLATISEGPRPPSYMTDDGVDYLLLPQSRGPTVVLPSELGEEDVHPALRDCSSS